MIEVLLPIDADLEPLIAALGATARLVSELPEAGEEGPAPILLVDLRGADAAHLADLAPPRRCRLIAIVDEPLPASGETLGANLLLVTGVDASPARQAAGLAALAAHVEALEAAYRESENLLEIQQEVIKAAGESIRLKEELEEQTRALRVAHDQVERTRRLTALGTLAAGMAHEFNNPMTSILGLTQVAQGMIPTDNDAHGLLGDVIGEAQRLAGLLRDFHRVVDEERAVDTRPFDPRLPVRAALEAFSTELSRSGIRAFADVDDPLPMVAGSSAEVQEAISHLLRNACQALPEGGEVRVRVFSVADDAVSVSVSDDGPGVPAELRERVFDPFFTTRSAHKQTGLGLSVTHRIVTRHHGNITIDDTPGGGARFTITLPAAPKDSHLY